MNKTIEKKSEEFKTKPDFLEEYERNQVHVDEFENEEDYGGILPDRNFTRNLGCG